MTWNVQSGARWKEIADVVRANNVDIAGLQEVDKKFRETTEWRDICSDIAEELRFFSAFGPGIQNGENQFGNCIVSRFPVISSHNHPLPVVGPADKFRLDREPRALLETAIDVNGEKIRFLTTHLSFSNHFETIDARKLQVEKLLHVLAAQEPMPTIVAGDFNCLPQNEELHPLKEKFHEADPLSEFPTWPMQDAVFPNRTYARGPTYKIDYIFISKQISVKRIATSQVTCSDHAPIVATLELA